MLAADVTLLFGTSHSTCRFPLAHSFSLAIGSPLSALSTCVAKITAINAKHGPFDACVLVGDVFAEGSDGSEVSGVKCA